MPDDEILTHAQEQIRKEEKRIARHKANKALVTELGHLQRELDNLPPDATVVITVRSPATGKERLFSLPRDSAPGLLEFVHDEVTRLETPTDAV